MSFALEQTAEGLALRWLQQPKMLPLQIDFCRGKSAYRAAQATRRDEAIARACGLGKIPHVHILDGTAGLGRDALVLAQLGAKVGLNERHPMVVALLQDALKRLQLADPKLAERLYFAGTDCFTQNNVGDRYDVVYLDPMYPKQDRKAKAAVKKDMQMFQQLIGSDQDADSLLTPALALARRRVVVKRPHQADFLNHQQPDLQLAGSKHRFDIYLTGVQHD